MKVLATRELVRFPATPYLYRVEERGQIIIEPEVLAELEQATDEARRTLAERLALTPKKEVYLFVHGVNTSFDEAVLSAAENWHFLGREGVPIAYTWPAGEGGLFFYTADRESGEYTVLHFKQLLRILADIPEIERIHIAAHSRGTDVVTTALRELIIEARAAGIDPREQLRIDNLVLLAADLDLEVVMQRIGGEYLGPAFGRLTIYTNADDEALSAARTLFHSRQRLGSMRWESLTDKQREFIGRATNLDIVVYEGSGGGPFGHSYYREPAVSSDILSLLRYGWLPGEGQRKGLEQVGVQTWRISSAPEDRP